MTDYWEIWHCSHCDHTEKVFWLNLMWSSVDERSAVYERDGVKYMGRQKPCVKCGEWTDIKPLTYHCSEDGEAQSSVPVFMRKIIVEAEQ